MSATTPEDDTGKPGEVDFNHEWPLAELRPADYNPRKISPEAFEKLQDSLRILGVVKPVILNRDGTLVAGHQRTRAMKAIGMTHTPALLLDRKVRRSDEIAFNLFHNSIETDSSIATLGGDLVVGYQVVPWEAVTATKGNGSGTVIKEISDLLAKYGPWGSVVCAPDGSVIANADYALACKLMRVPVLAYVVPDVQVPALVRAFAVDYGEYCFDPLDTTTYAQAHAQLNRLRGERDTDGKLLPHSGDTESQIYRYLVGPHLAELDPVKPRMIDFGCGHADHAKRLQQQDYPIIAYEPHSRIPGRDAFDVRHIASTVACPDR